MAVIIDTIHRERAAPRCERNGMEEHRTKGGAGGIEWRRTWRVVIIFTCKMKYIFELLLQYTL